MRLINEITNEPRQNHKLILDDGTVIDLSLRYVSNQQGWFYSIVYGSFELNNRRIVTSPNMLRQFQKFLSFGFAVTTTDGGEPVFINDFQNGRAKFYLLNSDDVLSVEEDILSV